ncbi:Polysaccharide biosynthesis protein [Marine Group I thaumarchaeote SCGC AAA799-P11]|uniref:Polysaccharide biosynthesis protein n=1 Tax=Marine Group I thaumarchaeote SCGC AAA799-P11 TaxID=1502295 RepID=A0A087S313_9ARCH|nr:Polysaccharide biosynthesis protein [Marine Group I thaumarchaeote SCGC AAA799-P11]
MSEIRVTYSGLISFLVGLSTLVTGLMFSLIITRTLNPQEYGTWGLISSLFVYAVIINGIVTFWTAREIARGEKTGKTAVFFSEILSVGGILIYLIAAYFVSPEANVEQNILFFAALLIPLTFLHKVLSTINTGWKPEITSYAIIVTEIIKIPLILIFLILFDLGISGLIITLVISSVIGSLVQVIKSRQKLRFSINKIHIKKWLKISWLPSYHRISTILFASDIVIFSVIIGSVEGIAFYSAALIVASIVSQSGKISSTVYGKLLGGGERKYLENNLMQLFYFAIPLATISILYAKPILFALNPLYEISVPVVIFLTIRTFFFMLTGTFSSFLTGIEQVDMDKNSTFKDYIKSKLFVIPNLQIIQYGVYLLILTIYLTVFKDQVSQIELVVSWSIIGMATQIPLSLYLYRVVKRNFEFKLNKFLITTYSVISIGSFGGSFVLTEVFLIYKSNIFEFLPNLIGFVLLGIAVYLILTYVVDDRTRKLFKAAINEVKKIR